MSPKNGFSNLCLQTQEGHEAWGRGWEQGNFNLKCFFFFFLSFSENICSKWAALISLTPFQTCPSRRLTSCHIAWSKRRDVTESTNALPSWKICCPNILSLQWVLSSTYGMSAEKPGKSETLHGALLSRARFWSLTKKRYKLRDKKKRWKKVFLFFFSILSFYNFYILNSNRLLDLYFFFRRELYVAGVHCVDFPGVWGLSSIQLQNVLHKKDQHAYRRSSCFRRWVIWRKPWCWNSLSSMWRPWAPSWSSSSRRLSRFRRTCKLVSLTPSCVDVKQTNVWGFFVFYHAICCIYQNDFKGNCAAKSIFNLVFLFD